MRLVDKNNDGDVYVVAVNDTTQQDKNEITGSYHYYPFGMTFDGVFHGTQGMNRYKYNACPPKLQRRRGKELDDVSGWYDYGARWYDASIGRFTGVDPIADEFAWVSGFNYAENEPIANIDLWGMQKKRSTFSSDMFGDDQVGIINNATEYQREQYPVRAGMKDMSHLLLTLVGLDAIDNAVHEGNGVDVTISVASFILGSSKTNGTPRATAPRVNWKSQKTSRQGQFVSKNSSALDPPMEPRNTSTVEMIGEIDMQPFGNSLRPQSPMGTQSLGSTAGKVGAAALAGSLAAYQIFNSSQSEQNNSNVLPELIQPTYSVQDNTRINH